MKSLKKLFGIKILMTILFLISLSAQTENLYIDGKQYVKEAGKWFVIENKSDSKYLLDETYTTINLNKIYFGIYIYRIQAGNFTANRKMLLIK